MGYYDFAEGFDALRRVEWVSVIDPTRRLPSLFNPNQLPFSKSATIANLQPIGSSQPSVQYAHTGPLTYSVDLPFSLYAYQQRGIPFKSVHDAHRFFMSFLHGRVRGEAPAFLKMVWPKTAIIVNTVTKVDVNLTHWDMKLNCIRYVVKLALQEVRHSYTTMEDVHSGAALLAPDGTLQQQGDILSATVTGKRLKVSHG
jgi:hypothetical protein